MEIDKEIKGPVEYINFQTIGCGSIRLGKHLVTKERIEHLCQVKDMFLLDPEGEEIDDIEGKYPQLVPNTTYTVACPENLESDEEISQDEMVKKRFEYFLKCRERVLKMQEARIQFIRQNYQPLHKHLYQFDEKFLLPSFVDAVKKGTKESLMSILKQETPTKIYSFNMLDPTFCSQFLEEIEHFEACGLPLMRPNSMNNYGVVIDEIGFRGFIKDLREKYLDPFCKLLYPKEGSNIDSHHAFIVEYRIGFDLDLDFHYDESEITLNVCLGKEFTGGDLYFKGLLEDPSTHDEFFQFQHKPGVAILHIGKHRHGASKIRSGHRSNLIIWMRDSQKRKEEEEKAIQERMAYLSHGHCNCGHPHDDEDENEDEDEDH